MNGRDLLIVGAILLVATFAAADALRRDEAAERTAPPRPATTLGGEVTGQELQATPPGYPSGSLRGWLVFTDAEDCRIREIWLAGGDELPLARLAGSCDLWAAPAGSRIAYGVRRSSLGAVQFKFFDPNDPDRDLGGDTALFGFIAWSLDGQRAGWCGPSRTGFDLEFLGDVRRLDECPSAYTPMGEVAYVRGDRLLVGDRTVLRAAGDITYVAWGRDGSLVVALEGRRLERRRGGRLAGALNLPRALKGRLPVLSPDNCAALFRSGQRIVLLGLGCFRGEAPRSFFGTAAAWSPDGEWIAVAERATIAFHRVVGLPEVIRWPAAAAALAWRE